MRYKAEVSASVKMIVTVDENSNGDLDVVEVEDVQDIDEIEVIRHC